MPQLMPRWFRCLNAPGAVLLPDGGQGGYAVFPKGDRRRRPLARVARHDVLAARADGWLTPHQDGFTLSRDVRNRKVREQSAEAGFLAQHGGLEAATILDDAGRNQPVIRRSEASPLARWIRPGPDGAAPLLDRFEFEAGERLRSDHARSTMSQRLTADWTAPPRSGGGRGPSGPEDAPVSILAARDRVMDALAALGPGLDRVVFAACIRETGLTRIEREESWPKRSAKVALKLGLTRLAVHYGMKRAQPSAASL